MAASAGASFARPDGATSPIAGGGERPSSQSHSEGVKESPSGETWRSVQNDWFQKKRTGDTGKAAPPRREKERVSDKDGKVRRRKIIAPN
jgi:hypothetical protein